MAVNGPGGWLRSAAAIAAVLTSIDVAGVEPAKGRAATSADQSRPVTQQEIRTVCGSCHDVPPPDILPRAAWRRSFEQMALIRAGGRQGTEVQPTAVPVPDDMLRVLGYYEQAAPERLPPPEPWPRADPSRFKQRPMSPGLPGAAPTIANVRLADLDGDGRPEVVATDMREGIVLRGDPRSPASKLEVIASIPHPSRVSVANLDGDRPGLLVGDLGRLLPGDHLQGAVIWLRPRPGGGYAQQALEGWPRVADVQAGDFDGDGTPDLAVAAFGWRTVGRLSILENKSRAGQQALSEHLVDARPGAIDAVPVDLDKDGKLDLVALFSQQFESVIAYINKGTPAFTFEPVVLYKAPHPNWGSSGMQVVDLDGDGDLDVVVTNGDSFDDDIVKPYHGIQWLENVGGLHFRPHHLAALPGVHRAVAVDLDGDGDLDLVGAALLAGGSDRDESQLPSLVWLEQKRRGVFERHTLSIGSPRHATVDAGDIDGDGDADIVVGVMTPDSKAGGWVEVWENLRR